MASFFHDLWASVFIPGTTPALALATNVTFFLLQIILLILLYATLSYHFIAMNILCAGLWGGINWFVKEVEEFKIAEEAKKLESEKDDLRKDKKQSGKTGILRDALEPKKNI
ncbi:Pkr1-domain-containing protein [Terfezia boudieri ATCC MYA-4762]|uniref:Pkr1-domain-containing protein n=1 Tax=Terfezia boudieri ATCC MYA-4762 TaxID=1051890 RepID=A0A3N4LUI6_9PEZI|nr:Pkr1-domain-containing protein [Terfezia boudieri ATCC MYA-4762]